MTWIRGLAFCVAGHDSATNVAYIDTPTTREVIAVFGNSMEEALQRRDDVLARLQELKFE